MHLKKSIGEQKMLLIQLKIKEDADHAGLSQLQEHFNLDMLLQDNHCWVSLNNNWLIVVDQKVSNVKDVVVLGQNGLLIILITLVLF